MYDLREHNVKPYNEIVDSFNAGNQIVLYTCGTGIGKSYVAAAVMQTLPCNKILYVVPYNAIAIDLCNRAGFQKYVDEHKLKFVTFNKFSELESSKRLLDKYDFVIVDEAHHLGSDLFGKNLLNALRATGTVTLALTATPKRDSDGVNVADLVDDTVYGLTVSDAVLEGLMPKMEYVCCSPDIDDVKYAEDNDMKLVVDYDSSAELLKSIVETNQENKWLVYFGTVAELDENEDFIKSIFPDYVVHKIAGIYGNTKLVSDLFQENEKVVLMSCNAILEGVHTDGVQGIIIMRGVQSVTVFEQMIGRCCRIGNTRSPIIVDCKNVYRALKRKNVLGTNHELMSYGKKSRDIFYTTAKNLEYVNIEDILGELNDSGNTGSCIVDGVEYEWNNDQDLSRQLGKSISYVSTYRSKGKSYEEIIRKALLGRGGSCIVDGVKYEWCNNKDLSIKLGMGETYVSRYRGAGESYEKIIRRALAGKSISCVVNGVTYEWSSDEGLSLQLGKSGAYVREHRGKGESYEEIIHKALLGRGSSRVVNGVTYEWSSDKDLSLQLGKSKAYVCMYRSRGKSYEEIIHKALLGRGGSCVVNGVTYAWSSDKDLSLQLGKSKTYVSRYRGEGASYEEIIREALADKSISCVVNGVIYEWSSDKDLSLQLGKNESYVRQHRRNGDSYEDIIRRALGLSKDESDTTDMGLF